MWAKAWKKERRLEGMEVKEKKCRERRGDREHDYGHTDMVWALAGFNTAAAEKSQASLVVAFAPRMSKGLSGGAVLFSSVAVFQPWSLFSHPFSRCVQPTQKTRKVNSGLSNQTWLHRDNAARFNSPHTLWHLRRRNHEEQIKTCRFTCAPLPVSPACELINPHALCFMSFADGVVVAGLNPGRDGQLASHWVNFLLSSRQIRVSFIQAGGTKAAQNNSFPRLESSRKQACSIARKSLEAFC